MKEMEQGGDWLDHITWRGEEEDQGVYLIESRQGSEKTCKLGINSLIYLIIENESQAPRFIEEKA